MLAHLWASAPAPSEYITHRLSEHWGVPPAVVRAQPVADIEATLVILSAEATNRRRRQK